MIKLIKESKEKYQPEKYECCYKLMKGNQPLGYATINKDKENKVFIFINKDQRGNGYGKILFSKMLEETKEIGFNEVKVTFSKENVPMLKIATNHGGKQISSDEDSVKYAFSLK